MQIDKVTALNNLCSTPDNIQICSIPKEIGSGYLRKSTFSAGIEVVEIDAKLTAPLDIPIEVEEELVMRMLFSLRWSAEYTDSERNSHSLGQFDAVLTTQRRDQKCFYNLSSSEPIQLFIIEVDFEYLQKRFGSLNADADNKLEVLLRDLQKSTSYFSKNKYTLGIHSLIMEYKTENYEDKMLHIFRETKITEIIIERFKQLLDDQNGDNRKLMRQATIRQVKEAAIWIADNLDNLGTIKEISRRVGLSTESLQNGFQQQFGSSVNHFIVDLKLNKAIELLDNSSLNISEIATELGISSRSYLSKIFKQKFGIGPTDYRKLQAEGRLSDSNTSC